MGPNLHVLFLWPTPAKLRTENIELAQCSGVFIKVVLTVIAESPPRDFIQRATVFVFVNMRKRRKQELSVGINKYWYSLLVSNSAITDILAQNSFSISAIKTNYVNVEHS